jgi:hypothetical protein
MKNKLILTLIVSMFLISLISANQIASLGTFKQNECIDLKQSCADCSYINFTRVSYPDGTRAMNNTVATKDGSIFNLEFCNTDQLGTYIVEGIGDVEGTDTVFAYDFEITYLGKTLDSGKAMMSIGFLALLVLIFFLNFIGMGFLPKRNQTDEDGRILSITYLKYFRNVLWMTGYFLFIGIVYIASNLAYGFLDEVLIADTLFMIFRVSFGLAPVVVIVWLIWIFVSMFHDKQFQKMLNRGIFPGGNL